MGGWEGKEGERGLMEDGTHKLVMLDEGDVDGAKGWRREAKIDKSKNQGPHFQ